MPNRLMTIDDLIAFCENNNFDHFSAGSDDSELVVQVPAKCSTFTADDECPEGLTPFVAKAYHDHLNLNNSYIETSTLKDTLHTATIKPILANIITNDDGEKDFGSHDFEVVKDENGKERYIYHEQPVGVIFGNNTIEYDEEAEVNRAILHGYLYDEYCQDAVDIINRRGGTACSVELSIKEMSFDVKEKYLVLDDFVVRGLTLLGENVKPGMAGSSVSLEDFSAKSNMTEDYGIKFENGDFMESIQKLISAIDSLNMNISKKGGTCMSKLDELMELYGVTADDITFEVEGMSDEDLEAAFEEAFKTVEDDPVIKADNAVEDEPIIENEPAADPEFEDHTDDDPETDDDDDDDDEGEVFNKTCSVELNGKKYEYALSLNETISALETLVNNTYAEADNTYYGVTVFDSHVVMHDCWNGRAFRQEYKCRKKKYSLVGDRVEVYANYLTKDEEAELEKLHSNFAELQAFKANIDAENERAAKMEVLNVAKFDVVRNTEDFKELVKDIDSYSISEIETKAKVIYADNVDAASFAAADTNTQSRVGVGYGTNGKPKPYGDLFD